jgi:hypothetical protein
LTFVNSLYWYSLHLWTVYTGTVYMCEQLILVQFTFVNSLYWYSLHLWTVYTGTVYICEQFILVQFTFVNSLYWYSLHLWTVYTCTVYTGTVYTCHQTYPAPNQVISYNLYKNWKYSLITSCYSADFQLPDSCTCRATIKKTDNSISTDTIDNY